MKGVFIASGHGPPAKGGGGASNKAELTPHFAGFSVPEKHPLTPLLLPMYNNALLNLLKIGDGILKYQFPMRNINFFSCPAGMLSFMDESFGMGHKS